MEKSSSVPPLGRTRGQTHRATAAVLAVAAVALTLVEPPPPPPLPRFSPHSRLSMGMDITEQELMAELLAPHPARPRARAAVAVVRVPTDDEIWAELEAPFVPPRRVWAVDRQLAPRAPSLPAPPIAMAALETAAGGHARLAGDWLTSQAPRPRIAYYPATTERAEELRGATQALQTAAAGAYSLGYRADWARTQMRYEACCRLSGHRPYPVSFIPLSTFLVDTVVNLKRSPTSMKSRLTSLKKAVTLSRKGWTLDAADHMLLGMIMRGLRKSHKGQGARGQKEPFRLSHIGLVMDRMQAGDSFLSSQELLQILLAHAGMLRTAEHTDGHLLASDIRFLEENGRLAGVTLRLREAKTGKEADQFVSIGVRQDRFDVVRPLLQYMTELGLLLPEKAHNALFRRANGEAASNSDFRALVKRCTARLGLPPAGFGGHSLRRGSANDAFDAGIPLDVIMRQGRWKSTAWMVYRRSTTAVMRLMATMQPCSEAKAVAASTTVLTMLKQASDSAAELVGEDSDPEPDESD